MFILCLDQDKRKSKVHKVRVNTDSFNCLYYCILYLLVLEGIFLKKFAPKF